MVADTSALCIDAAEKAGLFAERYVGDQSPEYELSPLPASPIRGVIRDRMIRPGVWMHWGEELVDRPVIIRVRDIATPALFTFSLEGAWLDRHGEHGEFTRSAGSMSLIHGPSLTACGVLPAPSSFHVTIAVSADALRALLADDIGPAASFLRELASGRGSPDLTVPLTPAARLAIESIRRCPHVGAIRAMALEARCNDLLVEMFNALGSAATRLPPSPADAVRAAAGILGRELVDPPALAELARRVGLSETALKRGFRQELGTTAFGHLRRLRMEHARRLLESGRATVVEASFLVGYSNPSHFAAAFRSEFGVNPKAFQLASGGGR